LKNKVKDKYCVYCVTRKAEEEDHVFAREFFFVEHRDNLPWAPACGPCNRAKSKLEDYLVSVLAFGARHEQAREYLMETVVRRLPKNKKLGRAIVGSMRPAFSREENGLYMPTVTMDFDGSKIEAFLKMAARGLAWYHWQTYIGSGCEVRALIMADMLALTLESVINENNANRVSKDIGNAALKYDGLQSPVIPEITVWGITMYGGVALSGGVRRDGGPIQTSSRWIAITGPAEIAATIDRLR
jgi:hypothetical protein